MIAVPPDGLCLSHACVAAFNLKNCRDEHGETGDRLREIRSEEQAEERQARCFRAQVVKLMREYALFGQARGHYNERALAIEAGGMPEDIDKPFHAVCLNGSIKVEPLGYASVQTTLVIGAGPLRIYVGNLQTKGKDGVFTGHFVLLQSWMPIQEKLEERTAFPFGVRACSTLTMHQSPESCEPALAAIPLAEQHQEQKQTVPDTKRKHEDVGQELPSVAKPVDASARKGAKNTPLLDVLARQKRDNASGASIGDSASKMPRLEYSGIVSSAQTVGLHALKLPVNKLLKDIQSQGADLPDTVVRDISHAVLVFYRWTADTTHKSRDAMPKVASSAWKVQRTVRIGTGKPMVNRPPREIAQDLEQHVSAKVNLL